MNWGDIDWGDMPTAIAAVFAGLAAWYARKTMVSQQKQISEQQEFIREQSRTLRLEQDALVAAAEERRASQAQEVHLKAGRSCSPDAEKDRYGTPVVHDQATANVLNGSREPIRDVAVIFGRAQLPREASALWDLQDRAGATYRERIPVLGGGRRAVFVTPVLSPAALESERPVMLFTDANEVRWRLDEHGGLREATDEDEPGHS